MVAEGRGVLVVGRGGLVEWWSGGVVEWCSGDDVICWGIPLIWSLLIWSGVREEVIVLGMDFVLGI